MMYRNHLIIDMIGSKSEFYTLVGTFKHILVNDIYNLPKQEILYQR